eukprot:CCRYP_014616-RB/>CCRYP_014616-RB protein AED:0.03 eAED:0.03 QI:97/1/1/1/0.4/0.33/6/4178/641
MSSTSILLAIDAGSSSIRCKAYEFHPCPQNDESHPSSADPNDDVGCNRNGGGSSMENNPKCKSMPLLQAIDDIHHAVPMTCVLPNTGHIRIHAVLTAIDECIDNVLRLLRRSSLENTACRVVAVGFSTFVMNLIGVDDMGEPVGESATLSYACNRSDVVEQCLRWKENLISETLEELYQRTGAPLHSAYALPQLCAFYELEPESLCERVHRWQTISSICVHRWMGGGKIDMPISYSEASWTGMLNFQTCSWDETAIQLLESCDKIRARNIMNLLPELVDFDGTNAVNGDTTPLLCRGIPQYCCDGKRNPYWDRWPELRGKDGDVNEEEKSNNTANVNEVLQHCRLFLGIGDGAAANLGSKCDSYPYSTDDGRRIAVTVGTSAAARVCIPLSIGETVSVPRGLFCYRVDKNRVLIGGALTDGGSVVEWARTLLNLLSQEAFDSVLEQVSEHYANNAKSLSIDSSPSHRSGAVTVIPFLSGERSTGFRGSATACISGITRETTPSDILYACLEGVTIRLAAVIDLIRKVCGVQQHRETSGDNQLNTKMLLVVSGNALERNSLWRQMIADCTGWSVVVDGDSNEGTCRGVAMLIARSFQTYEQGGEPLCIVKESLPNAEIESRWSCAALDQENLINAVSNTWNG